jgi:DNA-binding NtrC family response regulator
MPTIMYVDDDESVRSTVRRMLERQGVVVEVAEGVHDAQSKIAGRGADATRIDGIFIDIWLGDGTAFELVAWLQEHAPQLRKRAALVTGDIADDVPADRTLRALGLPVFAKPFDAAAMAKTAFGWSDA